MGLWLPRQWGSDLTRRIAAIFLIFSLVGMFPERVFALPRFIPGHIADTFPESDMVEKKATFDNSRYVVYIATTGGKTDGYAVMAKERGKSGDIVLTVVVTPEYSIKNITVHKHMERKGKRIQRKRFLRQFIGKTNADKLSAGKDVDTITGATISSKAVIRAAKRSLEVIRLYQM